MPAWSSLGGNALRLLFKRSNVQPFSTSSSRMSSNHKTMVIVPSRWQWHKFKDLLHFYALIGLIPMGLIITYANLYIGPAKLAEIPENYTPNHWEYYKHPITRFLARYTFTPPQQEYEKYLHQLYEEDEKMKIRALESKIKKHMKERSDYQAFYYVPSDGKYHRLVRKYTDDIKNYVGFGDH